MLKHKFLQYAHAKVTEGQSYFASSLKLMVQAENEELFDLMDDKNNEPFLNPMLFAYLNSEDKKISLEQILYGSVIEHKRHNQIYVLSNRYGEIYLPDFGYLQLDIMQEEKFTMITNNGNIEIYNGNNRYNYIFKKNTTILDTKIEIQRINNYLSDLYIPKDSLVIEKTNKNLEQNKELNQAVAILKQYYPAFFDLFYIVTKWLIPFNNSEANSFASLGMHGVGFINVFENTGVIFYLEDIVHQCGHVIFSSLTYKPTEFFTRDPETPIRFFNNDNSDDRDLYVLLHGVFTEGLMCEMFDICLEKKVFSSEKEHELKGRFSYILLRFIFDMEILGEYNYFSEKGQLIYNELYNNMIDKYKRYGYLLTTYDLSNQPYNFDFSKFILKNQMLA